MVEDTTGWLGILINGGAISVALVSIYTGYSKDKDAKAERERRDNLAAEETIRRENLREARDKMYLDIIKGYGDKVDAFHNSNVALADQIERLADNNMNIADVLSTNGGIIKKYIDTIEKNQK